MKYLLIVLSLSLFACDKPVLCDFTCDGEVMADDLAAQKEMFNTTSDKYDVDGDGIVAGSDIAICMGEWTPTPTPAP